MILQRGRIFGLVLFKRRVTDQGVELPRQRQSGVGAGEGFLVLFKKIEQVQELALKWLKIILEHFKHCKSSFTSNLYVISVSHYTVELSKWG